MDDHSPVTFKARFLSGLIGPRTFWPFLAVIAGISATALTEESQRFHVSVLALAPQESRAVIQVPSGALINVALGDVLPEIRAKVVAVQDDKLVLEMLAVEGVPATPHRVWVYRVTGIAKSSMIYEFGQALPPRPPIRRPVSHSIDVIGLSGRPLPN